MKDLKCAAAIVLNTNLWNVRIYFLIADLILEKLFRDLWINKDGDFQFSICLTE